MRTELTRALDFLGEPGVRFQVPVYQRVYSWTRPQCEELWADLMQAAAADEDHFMGTVLSGAPDAGVDAAADAACAPCADAGVRAVDLVDGQQRMVTLTLLLSALCSAATGADDEQLWAQAADLAERCLFVRAGAEALTKMELAPADQRKGAPRGRRAFCEPGGQLPLLPRTPGQRGGRPAGAQRTPTSDADQRAVGGRGRAAIRLREPELQGQGPHQRGSDPEPPVRALRIQGSAAPV